MKQEKSNILKKTIKIASVTCVALGGAALIASGAALKALTEGTKVLKNTVRKIIKAGADAEAVINAVAAEEAFVEDAVTVEEFAIAEESCDPV